MQRIGHTVIAVIAGVVVAFALVAAIEWLGQQMYPTPPGLDLTRPDQAQDYVRNLPLGALLLVLTSWVVATFCGGIVAAAIEKGRPRRAAAIVGVVVLLVTLANLVLIPHPLWFSILGVASIVAASLAAGRAMSPVAAH
jgi:hypothetical protein